MAMLKKLTGLALALAAPALAQIEVGVVQVDASPLGEDYVTADVFIDVADESDCWTVSGIAGRPLAPGLTHWVYHDPNTEIYITSPGRGTPQREFATFVSLPRAQFSNQRFGPNGGASIPGAYDPPSPFPTFGLNEINVAFLDFPPPTDGANVPDFGFIARVTLENSPGLSGVATEDIVVSAAPTAGRLQAEYRVASATREHPTPLSEFTFGFYAVLEPSSLTLLLFACAALPRSIRSAA